MTATALILAGRRDGRIDPLAEEHGCQDKCMVPIRGKPLIFHVVSNLVQVEAITRIVIVGGEKDTLQAVLKPHTGNKHTSFHYVAARSNIVDSVLSATEYSEFPILITTADNVLLTADSVREFIGTLTRDPTARAAVAMTRREAVYAAHPVGQRRFYEFSDGAFSNCNLYWIADRNALAAVETFRGGGQFVKFPVRIARAFGPLNLLRFKFGIGTTESVFGSISRKLGIKVQLIELSDGAAAIDVDNARSYEVTRQILAERAA